MRSLVLCTVILALGCAGCASAVAPPEPVVLSQKQADAARKAIARELRDPESARFGPIVAGRDYDKKLLVCGWVNSKNAFGGYVGETGFGARLEERPDGTLVPLLVRIQDNLDRTMAVSIMCARAGGLPARY